jgi:catechol 2,3-dioxygenase-like lactoylglutathione lyase family enzyme
MLFCQDLAKAKTFYTETLGLQSDPQMSSDTFLLVNLPPGIPISLQPASDAPAGLGAAPGGLILGLLVADVDATYQDLKGKGVDILTEVHDIGVGRSFQAKDPDGTMLEIYQYYAGFGDAQPSQ